MMSSQKGVRVRFAPSPTGPFHIGSARTALFNWIFAKSHGGDFILRIEDTDTERSRPEFEDDIKRGLKWLGMEWDEFYRQSERSEIYAEHAKRLLEEGWAYFCFCKKEDLEAQRQAMLAQGIAPKYSGSCRAIDVKEAEQRVASGEDHVIRLKIPDSKIEFNDIIRGNVSFDGSLIGDTVIAKDVTRPLYNFAVVVDDALQNITHVIRGEDHISNTPRQIAIWRALGFEEPKFAHIPMILNPDRSKMSKRFSDTALADYISQGFLSDAMVNFLAFLGWHPKEDKDVMSLDEIIEEFDLVRVQKGGAVFNSDKLEWLNAHYINTMGVEDFIKFSKDFLPDDWKLTREIAESARPRIKKFSDLKNEIDFYFEKPEYDAKMLVWKTSGFEETIRGLQAALRIVEDAPKSAFGAESIESRFMENLPEGKRGQVLWPLRVALSGKRVSPGPFEIMHALGKDESSVRIRAAIDKIGDMGIVLPYAS